MTKRQRQAAVAAFRKALKAAGSNKALAEVAGLTAARISQVKKRGEVCPIGAVLRISRAYGIPAHVLRPDIYEAPEPAVDSIAA